MSAATSNEKLMFVKNSLFKFISTHVSDADVSVIDDIIMSYVYSSFEGGTEEFYNQLNDVVTDFADMMAAYVTGFEDIERNEVCAWMIHVVHCLNEMSADKANEEQGQDEARALDIGLSLTDTASALDKPKKGSRSNSTSDDEKELREKAFAVYYEDEYLFLQCHQLQEMFPETNPMEIKHCMSIAFGDINEAAAAVMHRRDSGQALECNAWQVAVKVGTADDNEIKHRIIARYSYVDNEAQAKEHKPLAPKHIPKKLVRYRDNKIVSLKGERFTEVPKADEDGVKKSNKKHHP